VPVYSPVAPFVMANFVMEITREQRRRTDDRHQPRRRYQISDQAFHFISPSAHTNTPLNMVFFAERDIYTVLPAPVDAV
jgi:hypothetical protein